METAQLSVHVVKCPFGVRELQFTSSVNAAVSSTPALDIGDHYAQVSNDGDATAGAALRNNLHYAVAGTRGIQQLVATTRGAHSNADHAPAGNAADTPTTASTNLNHPAPHADVFSMHDKGRLLLWDSHSGSLVAAHAFNPAFTVHQCVVTAACVYTTLEGSPATAGAEEETCVYAWDRHTLQPVTVLRGHEGRLTALAIAPNSADGTPPTSAASLSASRAAVLATASLDGTVRLWRHRHDAAASSGAAEDGKAHANPVQTLAVLPAAELGVIHGLRFLSADVLVAACSKCALAFVRLSAETVKCSGANGRSASGVSDDGMKWQPVRSTVDPDGSTTTLHVCPFNTTDIRKPSNTSNNGNAANARPASPINTARKRKNIVTGSTSGYLQEWVVDLSDGDSQPPASPTGDDTLAPPLSGGGAAAPPPIAGAVVRGRWHHKAHAATVDCIATDEDVVVSTSIFDGARLYHRRAGATCVITAAAVVPVLVPQLKQLVWGGVDGSLSVASYALFASGAEKELQVLWSCKPHAAAIRGVCLAVTPSLQWKALCVGAADGSVSVWRPAGLATPPLEAAHKSNGKHAAPTLLSRVLDVCTAPSQEAMVVVGLKKDASGYVLAVAEIHVDRQAPASATVLPLPASTQPGDVTCARLCRGGEATAAASSHSPFCLLVGTRSGQLLQYAKDTMESSWRLLGLCKWTATNAGRHSSITAISSMRQAAHGTALLAVTSQSVVGTSLATQRVMISVLQARLEKGALLLLDADSASAQWEGSVDVPAPAQGSLTSMLSSHSEEPRTHVSWVPTVKKAANANTAESEGHGPTTILVRDSRGMVIRCRYGIDGDASAAAAAAAVAKGDAGQTWSTPEALVKPSATSSKRAFAGIAPTADGVTSAEVVVTEGAESDIVCVNVATGRKRVVVKSAARHSDVGSVLCDAGTAAIRLAAVRSGHGPAAQSGVSLYDDQGREHYRVTRDGAVTSCAAAAATTAPTAMASAKRELSFTPALSAASARSSPARSSTSVAAASTAACTVLAASAVDRLLFVGYGDGLLQMVDTTDMFVFVRVWVKDAAGASQAIREVHYVKGVVLARLADDSLHVFAVPPRSILDQPMPPH